MQKNLEDYLWQNVSHKPYDPKPFARDVINEMVRTGMIKSHKQAWRTLDKWIDKGIWEYGSVIDLGWKTKI